MIITSGTKEEKEETITSLQDDCNDILARCAGNCGQKVLVFLSEPRLCGEWSDMAAERFCIECTAKMIKQS